MGRGQYSRRGAGGNGECVSLECAGVCVGVGRNRARAHNRNRLPVSGVPSTSTSASTITILELHPAMPPARFLLIDNSNSFTKLALASDAEIVATRKLPTR